MRFVRKEMQTLASLQRQTTPLDADAATRAWGNFKDKDYVQDFLLEEQYHLCCYSEVRADLAGLGYHIEHVEPKSRNPARTFDYTNLAACALDSQMLAVIPSEERFGGHFKLSRYHSRAFISCHQADSARYFSYLSDGSIVPRLGLHLRDTRRARYTIAVLNLNSEYLRQQRQAWWDEIADLFEQHQAQNWSLTDLAAIDLLPGRLGKGTLSPFFTLTRQFFGHIAEQVLRDHAPALL
ncbi:MAG: TIGR02646 family protein [Burkholderiales bacterium]|nr:TIGR02646 family protein [Burkholderiales bacterium]